jgi:hypothetical protein
VFISRFLLRQTLADWLVSIPHRLSHAIRVFRSMVILRPIQLDATFAAGPTTVWAEHVSMGHVMSLEQNKQKKKKFVSIRQSERVISCEE